MGDLENDGFQDIYLGTGHPGYEALFENGQTRSISRHVGSFSANPLRLTIELKTFKLAARKDPE